MNEDSKPRPTRSLSIDERPGRLPQISSDGLNIAYAFVVRRARDQVCLVLRCDADGGVWSSIHPRG